jgi:CheY-like chemotaxis protein
VLEVADTGTGIDPSIKDRVFEPYFTTKTLGPVKGTGLGLSTVHGIVKGHAGFIEIEDNVPRGTVVRIAFPRAKDVEVAAEVRVAAPPRAVAPSGEGRLVLLADDERLVRQASRSSLEALGYRVLEAENGAHAFELFTEHGADVSAVLLDLVMPGMPTPELLEKLRAARPDVPVLIVTGSVIDDVVRSAVGQHIRGWLTKPFGETELAEAFRRLGV